MEKRLSVLTILVEDRAVVVKINQLLHEQGDYIVARLGVPYAERDISVICVIIDAPNQVTSSLAGKIGMLNGVSIKTVASKTPISKKNKQK